jgi:TPR repeat protein
MRRQDVQLLALARQGDTAARCEAGRRYLQGKHGFPHHIPTGIDYLTHPNVRDLPEAARIIVENLSLEELLQRHQEGALDRAASDGSAEAQFKLGVWLCVRQQRREDGLRWLTLAASAGHEGAQRALTALGAVDVGQQIDPLPAFLRTMVAAGDLSGNAVALIAARRALAERDLQRLSASLRCALAMTPGLTPELAELLTATALLAEELARPLQGLAPQSMEAALDMRTNRGDRDAAFTLGRALCGIPCGVLAADSLAAGPNMRKGVALLLRAADGGRGEAWLHLYRMHGDHKLSVANPQMARFCLEKAALGGQIEAQRKLGALMLRASESLPESEQAIQWLHQAAAAHDEHAAALLRSLVLPLAGEAHEADAAIALVRREDPWLAVRMQLSRHFGLTKLEALCVDPTEGMRSWGLVVGKNLFISQIRLSAARAVPALTHDALESLKHAAAFFGQASPDALAFEGDLRRRSLRQRRQFERHGLDEAMFFSSATATTLEALRLGPKWAFREKEQLQAALA